MHAEGSSHGSRSARHSASGVERPEMPSATDHPRGRSTLGSVGKAIKSFFRGSSSRKR